MSDTPRGGTAWLLFSIAVAAGPATALVHEFDVVPLGPTASLWPLLAIVVAAALGIFLGPRIGGRAFRPLRWLAMVPNGLVLLLYGFLLVFFALGGSR